MDEYRWGAAAHSRLLGNSLLELDRFLSVLIDEVALGVELADHDPRGFARLRNTPNKLGLVNAMLGREAPEQPCKDQQRLRAIGRVAAVMRHCHGTIHQASIGDDIRLASSGACTQPGSFEVGTKLLISPQALLAISLAYRDIAARLLAGLQSLPEAAP